jgi:hypothetical protein
VPQGSVLGPIGLLILIYINDVEHIGCGNTKLQFSADNAKIYSNINIENTSSLLQRSLDNLAKLAKSGSYLSILLNVQLYLSQANCSLPHIFIILYYYCLLLLPSLVILLTSI